jgi:putative sterol carrier protein
MSYESALEFVKQRAANAEVFGKKLNFEIEGRHIHLDGTGECNEVSEASTEADCTIKISQSNFDKLIAGDLNPMMAFMMGQIKVDGDMSVAMKLQSLVG